MTDLSLLMTKDPDALTKVYPSGNLFSIILIRKEVKENEAST